MYKEMQSFLWTETILQSMEDAVVAVDDEIKGVFLNRAAQQLFGAKNGITAEVFFETLTPSQLKDSLIKVIRSNKRKKIEIEIKRSGILFYYAVILVPIKENGGGRPGCVAVLRDITEKKKLEEMQSEFLNMVSHELRTPLTPIQVYSELISGGKCGIEKAREYSLIINREIKRLGALIGDVLDLSRLEAGKEIPLSREHNDLISIICEVKNTFSASAGRHKIICDCPVPVKVFADRDKISQVLINLISNAVKYSPEGGSITIKAGESAEESFFSVSDEGIGISSENLKKIFDKFYRVQDSKIKSSAGGAGIGLSITKRIIDLHGGRITVKSEEEKGSEFCVFLPKKENTKEVTENGKEKNFTG
ncbi:MAG: PAS domain S-box protein [Candidatus Goldbacteria bacterium]|nr:PAS domain S-box protein [Candidatus Goldiibacteriota bacterium]